MKSEKGVTLISLIIYILAMLIVIGILAKVSGTFYKNVDTLDVEGTFQTETNKVKLYILEDIKERKMIIQDAKDGKAYLYNESTEESTIYYSPQDGNSYGIYRNNVLIAENITAEFKLKDNVLTVLIIDNNSDLSKTLEFSVNKLES